MPIEPFILDTQEKESYKQITHLTINKLETDYTSFCKVFVLFVSEKEINCGKSNVLRAFQGIASVYQFLDLGLPIKKVTTPNSANEKKKMDSPPKDVTIAFEIDLS